MGGSRGRPRVGRLLGNLNLESSGSVRPAALRRFQTQPLPGEGPRARGSRAQGRANGLRSTGAGGLRAPGAPLDTRRGQYAALARAPGRERLRLTSRQGPARRPRSAPAPARLRLGALSGPGARRAFAAAGAPSAGPGVSLRTAQEAPPALRLRGA